MQGTFSSQHIVLIFVSCRGVEQDSQELDG